MATTSAALWRVERKASPAEPVPEGQGDGPAPVLSPYVPPRCEGHGCSLLRAQGTSCSNRAEASWREPGPFWKLPTSSPSVYLQARWGSQPSLVRLRPWGLLMTHPLWPLEDTSRPTRARALPRERAAGGQRHPRGRPTPSVRGPTARLEPRAVATWSAPQPDSARASHVLPADGRLSLRVTARHASPHPARGPHALTGMALVLAVAKALEGAQGPGLGAHAYGGMGSLCCLGGASHGSLTPKTLCRAGPGCLPAGGRALGGWEGGGGAGVSENKVLPKS